MSDEHQTNQRSTTHHRGLGHPWQQAWEKVKSICATQIRGNFFLFTYFSLRLLLASFDPDLLSRKVVVVMMETVPIRSDSIISGQG